MSLPSPEGADAPQLPGQMDELPDGVAEATVWQPSRAPGGIDAGATYATRDEAVAAVAERLGEDSVHELIESPEGEAHILVTTVMPGDDSVAGEQTLVVLEESSDGWRFAGAWERWLCHREANGALCL